MGKDLVAHGTGFERATGLDILQLQEDPTSSCPGKAGGLDQWCLDPWRFEGLLLTAGGQVDAPHFDVLNKWKRKGVRCGLAQGRLVRYEL